MFGAIDEKHVAMQTKQFSEYIIYKYKGIHSTV